MTRLTAPWASVLGDHKIDELPGTTQPLWRVTAEDGSSFLLKQLPEFPPGVGPIEEYRVLQHLQANGISVAIPVVTDDGRICASHGEFNYSLLPQLPADETGHPGARRSKETCQSVGAAIAQLHRELARCPWPIHSFTHKMTLDFSEPNVPEQIRECITPEFQQTLEESLTDLPIQRIHGDCNTGNILLYRARVSGFIDLDHLPIGPRVYDIAYYLVYRLQDLLELHNAAGVEQIFEPEFAEYLSGYQSEAPMPLTSQELSAIAPAMFTAAAGLAAWHSLEHVYDAKKVRQGTNAAIWIRCHLPQLEFTSDRWGS